MAIELQLIYLIYQILDSFIYLRTEALRINPNIFFKSIALAFCAFFAMGISQSSWFFSNNKNLDL